jgi:hypothetical protein
LHRLALEIAVGHRNHRDSQASRLQKAPASVPSATYLRRSLAWSAWDRTA